MLSTDLGQTANPPVEDGLGLMADRLLAAGFDEEEVHTMAVVNTRRVAGARRVSRRLLVIGAHSADFVWRAGGAVAVTTRAGGEARVIALSYGERGESGELWKEPGQTVERVKEIRHEEAERAAAVLGADFRCLDLGDYPLEIDAAALARIADEIREFAPDVLVTHTTVDPFNPDHGLGGRRGRPRAVARRRRRRPERLRDGDPAGAPPLRAAPARAVRLRPDHVRRHHGACSSRSSRRWPR